MANLPVRRDEVLLEKRRRAQIRLADEIIDAEGNWRGVAKQLAKGDEAKAKRWRQRIRRWVRDDEFFQQQLAAAGLGEMMLGLPATATAMMRRASKGNIPAAKLAMEASGFYRPGVDHRHSGRIEIELKGVPRAPIVTDEDSGSIPDATVVEE